MSQAKLQAARELIQERNYSAARIVLETIPTDPTAQKWLAKLNQIAPSSKAAIRPLEPSVDAIIPQQANSNRQRKSSWNFIKVIVFFLLVLGVIAFIVRQQQLRQWEAKRGEARGILSFQCSMVYGFNNIRCGQWVSQTLNEDISRVDDIAFCDMMYNIYINSGLTLDHAVDSFFDCLADREIYMP